MSAHVDNLRKKIQKIIYDDLDNWKQHINDLEAKKITVTTFKKHYVEFLQKIEDNITQFTVFYLKKESHSTANQILEDDLEKTALLQTIITFLSNPIDQREKESQEIKNEVMHRTILPSVSASPTKKDADVLYRASESE